MQLYLSSFYNILIRFCAISMLGKLYYVKTSAKSWEIVLQIYSQHVLKTFNIPASFLGIWEIFIIFLNDKTFCLLSILTHLQISEILILSGNGIIWTIINAGEESLTIFVDKRKLSKRSEGSDTSTNSSSVTLETLHQLAASYFIDRDSTLRRLHHIQIASTAIKVWMSSF